MIVFKNCFLVDIIEVSQAFLKSIQKRDE